MGSPNRDIERSDTENGRSGLLGVVVCVIGSKVEGCIIP